MTKYVIDSDFIVALVVTMDLNHEKAHAILDGLGNHHYFVYTNLIYYEVATVLSKRLPHHLAIEVFDSVDWQDMEQIWVEEELTDEAEVIYREQTRKHISLVDCLNLHLTNKFNTKICNSEYTYNY